MTQQLRRFVVLISGRGTNMQAIVHALAQPESKGEVCAVLSNVSGAPGLEWAAGRGLATQVVAHQAFADRARFDQALGDYIDAYQPDYVLLAGFMRILTRDFVDRFEGRLINIHPSLLPSFPGLDTHRQALEAGVQWHGCTVHFVTPSLDNGPIIAQGIVPVFVQDDANVLAQRVLGVEHVVYAEVTKWLAQGRVHIDGRQRVQVDGVASRSFLSSPSGVEAIGA